jgi:hypothetical protein
MLKLSAEAAGTRAKVAKTTSAKIESLKPIVRTESFLFYAMKFDTFPKHGHTSTNETILDQSLKSQLSSTFDDPETRCSSVSDEGFEAENRNLLHI